MIINQEHFQYHLVSLPPGTHRSINCRKQSVPVTEIFINDPCLLEGAYLPMRDTSSQMLF